jgi:hypothetical protein
MRRMSSSVVPAQPAIQRRGGGNPVAIAGAKAAADRHALDVAPIILRICSARGEVSFGRIAAELNRRGVDTSRGGRWHAMTVSNLLKRAANLKQQQR